MKIQLDGKFVKSVKETRVGTKGDYDYREVQLFLDDIGLAVFKFETLDTPDMSVWRDLSDGTRLIAQCRPRLSKYGVVEMVLVDYELA